MIPAEAVHSPAASNLRGSTMQREMDLVRSMLLKIEEAPEPLRSSELVRQEGGAEAKDKVDYHLEMLIDQVGFVSGIPAHTYDGKDWINLNLTWAGHEFVDNIRDPEIWKQTKAGAAKVGGFSLKVLASVAEALLKARVAQLFGGNVDL